MRTLLVVSFPIVTGLVGLCVPVGGLPAQGGEQKPSGEWISLFDGKSLQGWRRLGGSAEYAVEDGAIVGRTTGGRSNTFLCTEEFYGDFELQYEARLFDRGINAGVQIRSHSHPEYRKGAVHGYQVELVANGTAGFIYDEARSGWLSKDRKDPAKRAALRPDEWNRFRVVCEGPRLRTWINDVPIADVTDHQSASGFIGLQVHSAGGDQRFRVGWRALRLRRIGDGGGWSTLFNGRDLQGWKVNENPDSVRVAEGALVVGGRRAHVFYDGPVYAHSFKNFDFHAEVMTRPKANSGIYFHTRFQESGWPDAGYECQVNNSQQDWRRTGGLYAVQDVREAPAADNEWFDMDIAVRGQHVTVHVDGKKTADYVEPPDVKRPRNFAGRLISRGTFAFQCHDPGSTVLYKDIRVRVQPEWAGERPAAGQQTPAKDTPAKDTPTQDTLAKDTPAQDTPAQDTPAQDAPAQDTAADPNTVVWEGDQGVGKGKHIVFLAGDHEYRGEEILPALARILAKHHGFKCTFLVTTDPKTGCVEPGSSHITNLEVLKTADLLVLAIRFQHFPDEEMQHIEDYLARGGPVLGVRTSTHGFKGLKGRFEKYNDGYQGGAGKDGDAHGDAEWRFGFGERILGEHWVGHFGRNHKQSSRVILEASQQEHPILRGVRDAHAVSGGYVGHPRAGSVTLARGQVLDGMTPDSPPTRNEKQQVQHPVAWVREYQPGNPKSRVFATTHGASQDLLNAGFRRMLVNAHLWCLGLEAEIRADAPIDFVGPFHPAEYRFGGHRKGVKPADITGFDTPIYDPGKSTEPPPRPRNQKRNRQGKRGAAKKGAKKDQ